MEVTLPLVIVLIQLLAASASEINTNKHDSLVYFNITFKGEHRDGSEVEISKFSNVNEYLSTLINTQYLFDEESICKLHWDIIRKEANNININALKILDATAKMPSGILNGNLNQYGDFDECVSAKILSNNQIIKGKYCLATFNIQFNSIGHKNLLILDDLIHSNRMFTNELNDAGHRIPKLETFNWGVCIPSTCTNDDVRKALQTKFKELDNKKVEVDFAVNDNMCFEEGERDFGILNIVTVVFFVLVIKTVLFATIIDVRNKYVSSKFMRYVRCFSLKKNYQALIKTDHSPDEISVLHGARFLNAIALLLSHKQMALLFNPIINRTAMAQSLGKPWSMIGRSAILYTDTFILLSGLLISFSVIKELDEIRRIKFKERFISRLVRFTPNLFALVMFCTFIMEHIGSGPQWGLVVKQYADLCKSNMWKNFLYIHNYFGFENMCLTHTHQLGIDMQLFLIAPFILYILWRNTKRGLILFFVLGMASTCLRYYVTEKERLSTLIYYGISVERLWRTAGLSYILPTHRLTVYIAGLALGYFMRRNGRKLYLSYSTKVVGWIIAVSSGLIAMFGPYHVSSKEYVYNVKDSAIYNAFSPILWIIFLSWAIIACDNGWGGLFNKFLCWKYFTIFTRISYAVYLIQFPVFFYGVGTQRSANYYTGFHTMIDLIEFLVIFLLSVLMTLFFDLPCQGLRKTYLEISKGVKKNEDSVYSEIQASTVKYVNGRRRLEIHGD